MRTEERGFTLIEVIVAIALLMILITVVIAPLTGLFGLTGDSSQRLSATSQAQQALEYIKSAWEDAGQYDATCVSNTLNISTYGTVTVQALNYNGIATGPVDFRTTCVGATSNSTAPIKRVTVVSTVGNSVAKLTLDLARPQ